MQGLMQDHPLTLPHFFDRVEALFPKKEVVTATATDPSNNTSEFSPGVAAVGGALRGSLRRRPVACRAAGRRRAYT